MWAAVWEDSPDAEYARGVGAGAADVASCAAAVRHSTLALAGVACGALWSEQTRAW